MAELQNLGKLQELIVQASNIEKEKQQYEISINEAYSRYLNELKQIYSAMIDEKNNIPFPLKLVGKDVDMENAATNFKNLINSVRPNTIH